MEKTLGLRTVAVGNGYAALHAAVDERVDLVLMDLALPLLDGCEAATLIHSRESSAQVPIIAVSAGCHEPEWRKLATQAGCVECVPKPVDMQQLIDAVSRYVPGK